MTQSSAAPQPEPICDLCGLALPSHPVEDAKGRRFCCHGCGHVAAILDAVGAESEVGQQAIESARQRGLLSTIAPEPVRPEITIPAEARESVRLRVANMACPSCGWLIESVIASRPGVADVHVDYLSDVVQATYDLRVTSVDDLRSAVAEAGYALESFDEPSGRAERRDLARLIIAAGIAMNLMSLAFVGYDSFLTGMSDQWDTVLNWGQLAIAMPVIVWCALPIYRRAWAALQRGRVVMETLLSIGILSATALSVFAVVTDQPHLYLETVTMLVTLSLVGRALERLFKRRAAHSLIDLLRFAPTKGRTPEGSFVPLASFAVGDNLVVEAGESVPLDTRLSAEVVVSEGLLTGEPHPVTRRAGDLVLAGSRVERGTLRGAVERPAGESVSDTMRRRVEEALRRADEGSRFADRLAQGFVPLVLMVAVASLVGHLWVGSGGIAATLAAVSVLVVACPCAFGLSASMALSLAVLRLAREGVLVKDPATLEAMATVDSGVFDKTGTLTQGELRVLRVGWCESERPDLLAAVRAMEAASTHPIGVALARALPSEGDAAVEQIVEVPAMGITATVCAQRLAAGKLDLFAPSAIEALPPEPFASRVWFGIAGEEPAGFVDLADTLRAESPGVIRALRDRGISSALFSGDASEPTRAAAESAGIAEPVGGLRPEGKAQRVQAMRVEGRRVAFVGDGFNDAEALAAADVGVALATGASLAMLSAPVVITRGDLRGVIDLVDVARRAVRVLRGNIAWAFAYNMALLPVAALGFLAPVHAASLMALSSVSVALNSLRVRSGTLAGGV